MVKNCECIKSYAEWPEKHAQEWAYTDNVLYQLCQEKYPSHSHKGEIQAKVLIIGRGFGTNVEKKIKGDNKLAELADQLLKKGKKTDHIIKQLNALRGDLNDNMGEVVRLHNDFCSTIIAPVTIGGKVQLTSFASKYLHFHSPIVPIFDKFASKGAKKIASYLIQKPSLISGGYKSYCENFLCIYSKLRNTYEQKGIPVSVRLVESFIFKTQKECFEKPSKKRILGKPKKSQKKKR